MKFISIVALGICLTLLLCLSFSTVFGQNNNNRILNMTEVNSPTGANLNSVFVVNNLTDTGNDLAHLNAWAVGDGGVILRWDGSSWAAVNSPTTMDLHDVTFINATHGWAVGGNANSGIILTYHDGTWSIWTAVTNNGDPNGQDEITQPLNAITVDTTGMLGWAVGGNGTIYGWFGDACYLIPSGTTATLRDVAMVPDSMEAWAVGDGGIILNYDEATNMWTNVTSPTNARLNAIEMITMTNGWAGGGDNNDGTLLHFNGNTWNVYNQFVFDANGQVLTNLNATVHSISLGNETSAWAVGTMGTVMYYNGTHWTCNDYIINGNLRSVSMVHGESGVNQAWTVGDGGRILAFTGTQWIPEIPAIAIPIVLAIGFAVVIFGKARLFKKTPLF